MSDALADARGRRRRGPCPGRWRDDAGAEGQRPARDVEIVLRDGRVGQAVGPGREPWQLEAKAHWRCGPRVTRTVPIAAPRPSKSWTWVSAAETGSVNRRLTVRGA